MTGKIKFKVTAQGEVSMVHDYGYMLVGCGDAVCFCIDPVERAYVAASTSDDNDCPVIYLCDDKNPDGEMTEIVFHEYPGWRFHAGGGGKSISIALVRKEAEND